MRTPEPGRDEERTRIARGLFDPLDRGARDNSVRHIGIGRFQDVPLEAVTFGAGVFACLQDLVSGRTLAEFAHLLIPRARILALLAGVKDLAGMGCEVSG